MRIWTLKKYQRQGRRGKGELFSHLEPRVREVAQRNYAHYLERHQNHLTPHLRGRLAAAATSQALYPTSNSEWGRSMLAKKNGRRGGLAVRQKYREQGRNDPCAKARYVKAAKAEYRKSQKSQEAQNLAHGTTGPRMLGNNAKAKPLVDGKTGPPVNFDSPERFNGYMLDGVPIKLPWWR